MEVTDGAAMSDLLEQCMFFGASMSRIGVDFRGTTHALLLDSLA